MLAKLCAVVLVQETNAIKSSASLSFLQLLFKCPVLILRPSHSPVILIFHF